METRAGPTSASKKRDKWDEESLQKALKAIREDKISTYRAEAQFRVPRRTLRRYLFDGKTKKSKLGRKHTLDNEEEEELCQRIIRLAQVGYPLTTKCLRLCVYKFCLEKGLKNLFKNNGMAGRK